MRNISAIPPHTPHVSYWNMVANVLSRMALDVRAYIIGMPRAVQQLEVPFETLYWI